jgi:hypothetical protein
MPCCRSSSIDSSVRVQASGHRSHFKALRLCSLALNVFEFHDMTPTGDFLLDARFPSLGHRNTHPLIATEWVSPRLSIRGAMTYFCARVACRLEGNRSVKNPEPGTS